MNDLNNIFNIMDRLGKSPLVGLLFTLFCVIGAMLAWYWVFFKGGDKKWSEGVMEYHRRIGFGFINKFFIYKPFMYKIITTIVLLIGLFALFLAIKDVLDRF